MGSHAKPRTTGRRTALSALALGATLTGIGLTAAALDPATAVLTASGADEGGATQLSGLATPVGGELSPAADGITTLSSAPLGNVAALTNAVNGTAGGALQPAGSLVKTATSGTLDVSTASSGRQTGVRPIKAVAPISAAGPASSSSASSPASGSTSSSTTGYTGKHVKTRSAAPPSDTTPLAAEATSGATSAASSVLPLAQGLLAKVPVVSSLVQGSGVTGTAGGLLGTATGTVRGTADGSSGDPVAGAVGGLPLVGTLLGGSGGGQSTLSVPGPSSLSGLL
ncbi:MAG TPA: hypothetical protein VH372_15300 [Actinospica sp.]|nr:hypothetical protein [Actinospica sp.]